MRDSSFPALPGSSIKNLPAFLALPGSITFKTYQRALGFTFNRRFAGTHVTDFGSRPKSVIGG